MNDWEWNLLENKTLLDTLQIAGVEVKAGDRVRLRPGKRADIFDMALAGKTAVIESIDQDYEGNYHICVVADDDPGRDIGLMRQPGHRFFFSAEEIEPLGSEESAQSPGTSAPAILIAGIGNIFLGDDGFGVEVARRLASRDLPQGVRVVDFGIRGFDLAYALADGPDVTILIDACPRGGSPGSVYVIEPDLSCLDAPEEAQPIADAHAMNPMSVLRMANSLGGSLKRILLVGCEPATLGPEEGQMGLSDAVAAAVEQAAEVTEALVNRILQGETDWGARERST